MIYDWTVITRKRLFLRFSLPLKKFSFAFSNLLWLKVSMPVDFMLSTAEKKREKSEHKNNKVLNWNETERVTISEGHITPMLNTLFESNQKLTFGFFGVWKDSFILQMLLLIKYLFDLFHLISFALFRWSSCRTVSLFYGLISQFKSGSRLSSLLHFLHQT